ncbi:hypothetical protein ACQ4PT_071610 [Festuca glaucescens]
MGRRRSTVTVLWNARHGPVRAQDGEVRRKEEEAGRRGGEEGCVGLGLRELRGRVAAGDGGAVACAAAGGRPRGAPLHAPSRRPRAVQEALPPTRWACEFNAALTVPFFHWLVGPSEVVEVEADGVKQRSGVLIKKCRYLENSGCVGMCVNMCKIPTQSFFTDEFGLPLTMNPNFEDMSCEMIYGQVPPPLEEDPVSKQPCYPNLCSISTPSAAICPKLQN